MPLELVPEKGEEDSGVYVSYPGWDRQVEWVRLHRVFSEEMLDAANAAALKAKHPDGRMNQGAYRTAAICAMVIDWRIKGRDGAWIPFTPATVARLPVTFRLWLTGEIDRCDGSIAGLVEVEIAGRKIDFRGPMSLLGEGQPAGEAAPDGGTTDTDGAQLADSAA